MTGLRCVVAVAVGVLALGLVALEVHAAIPTSERDALIAVYNSTNGGSWTHRDNWRNPGNTAFNDPGTECTWYGVTCDVTEDHVEAINLGHNNLDGTIPTAIGDFPSLVVLQLLSNPNLTGSIPASIGNLAALQSLNAYDGSLTGSLPPEIGNLSNLSWLALSFNDLDGAIPPEIGNLAQLTELELDGNQLSGSIPPEIGDLALLRLLRLESNELTGSVPPEIGNATVLRTLVLAGNQLSGSIPSAIGSLTSLQYLDLSGNNLSGILPEEIGDLESLYTLYVSSNGLLGPIPQTLFDLPLLRYLRLERNTFSGPIPPEISKLSDLRILSLRGNSFEGPIPDEIVVLVNLSEGAGLDIGYNALHTTSNAVAAFVDSKHFANGDWTATQTVAPSDVSVGWATSTMVELTWTPIPFTGETGGYTAWFATSSGGPYTLFSRTADKSANSMVVMGLGPFTTYYFVVDAMTDPHSYNPNTVVGTPQLEVSTRTIIGASPTVSIGDATVVEGDSGNTNAVFTVSLFPPAAVPVSLIVALSGGTATAGSDFVSTSVPVAFTLGVTFQTVLIPVIGDTHVEDNETFTATLTNVSGSGFGRITATAIIEDDDAGLVSHERQALIDLYNSTNGAAWTNRTNWRNAGDTDFNDPGTECTWYGVTCDSTNQRVTSINLSHNYLTGPIPASVGDFAVLEFLTLTGNNLVGEISPEIGRLAALQILDLAYSGTLTGPIPPELGNLSNLTRLDLYSLELSGEIPAEIGQLTNLTRLDLQGNQLTGPIRGEIGDLVSLQRLSLSYNQLAGSIPTEIGDLSALEWLRLEANMLSGTIPPELGQLANLRGIYLHSNQLEGNIPPGLATLSQLEVLNLNGNQLTGLIPPWLGGLSDLSWLVLDHNLFMGEIPPEIGSLVGLRYLFLRGNRLTGSIPPEIGSLAVLRRLDLGDNHLSGSLPPELGSLSNVERLYLDSNMFTGEIPTELADLTTLLDMIGLNLKWNGLHTDDVFLAAFLNLKHSSLGDWRDTQTIAPENLTVVSASDHTVWLGWDGVAYTEEEGGIEALVSPAGTGLWVSAGWTSSKSENSFPVTGLDPSTPYDFAVITFTNPHLGNRNLVTSDLSQIETTTTANLGCPTPEIVIDYGSVTVLSVPGTYSSYLWSTGETTATIDVPLESQWYWVRTTSTGGCEDSAVAWVTPLVFADGFETGDISGWGSP